MTKYYDVVRCTYTIGSVSRELDSGVVEVLRKDKQNIRIFYGEWGVTADIPKLEWDRLIKEERIVERPS